MVTVVAKKTWWWYVVVVHWELLLLYFANKWAFHMWFLLPRLHLTRPPKLPEAAIRSVRVTNLKWLLCKGINPPIKKLIFL